MKNFAKALVLIVTVSVGACSAPTLPDEGETKEDVPFSLLVKPINGGAGYILKSSVIFDMAKLRGIRLGKGNKIGKNVQFGMYKFGDLIKKEVTVTERGGAYVIRD